MATGHPGETKTTTTKPKVTPKPAAKKPTTTAKKPATITKPKTSTKPKAPAKKGKTEEEWAQYYQWSYALLKSDPSLYKVFQRAIKEKWTDKAKFIAAVRDTSWYKKNGDTARKTIALKYTDPETWRQRVRAIYTNVQALAGQMGVKASWQTYWDMAEKALMFGWDNAKLRASLSEYLKTGATGGEAGQARTQLQQYAYQMGIRINDSSVDGWLKGILNGSKTIEDYKGYIQKQAISAFPTLADDIKGGLMVRDIASPYMQSMANVLEINGDALDLYDPTIRKAMTSVNQDTGKPELKPLWQFEEELKKDPRWLKTNNARESMNGVAHGILKDWGFVS